MYQIYNSRLSVTKDCYDEGAAMKNVSEIVFVIK